MTLANNASFDPTTMSGLLATQWLMSEAAEEEMTEEVEVDPEEQEEDEEEGEAESDEN